MRRGRGGEQNGARAGCSRGKLPGNFGERKFTPCGNRSQEVRGGGAVGVAFSFECGGWRRYSSRVSVAAGRTSESRLWFSTYGLPQERVTQLETQWAEQIKKILTQ
jgi:hypothetical protein